MSKPQPQSQTPPEPEVSEETQTVEQYRTENFEEMGFTSKEARSLAKGKDDRGVPIRYDTVQNALDAGCTPRAAVRIFGELESEDK